MESLKTPYKNKTLRKSDRQKANFRINVKNLC